MHALRRAGWLAVLLACVARGQPAPDSVYPPVLPELPPDPADAPVGKIGFDLTAIAYTDYVFRGLERFEAGRTEDRPNVQFDARVALDLGRLPHPFVGAFANLSTGDPVEELQEVRPTVGFTWDLGFVDVLAANAFYAFPERDDLETAEVQAAVRLDTTALFRSERPLPTPYGFAAYDYDRWNGLYVEAGVDWKFPVETTGLTFTFGGAAAYARQLDGFYGPEGGADDGFPYYEVRADAVYELNQLLNIPERFGRVRALLQVRYTGAIEEELGATEQLWGGVGVGIAF